MKKNRKNILNLHRYLGLAICIFVIHLALSGIFLNHSDDLKLNKIYINTPWVLQQYNLEVPKADNVYTIKNNNFIRIDQEVFFNAEPILFIENDFVGVVKRDDKYILADNKNLHVMNNEGLLLTTLSDLPFSIKRIGMFDDQIYIEDYKDIIWSSTTLNDWENSSDNSVEWSKKGVITKVNQEKIKKYFIGNGISLEQVILDFHSGAIFKKMGKVFFDVISILLITLSISGIYLWKAKGRR